MSAEIEVRRLSIATAAHGSPVVNDLHWTLERGQTLGVVGESGSGKTTTALALLGVVRRGLVVRDGSVTVAGETMLGLHERALRRIRGRVITYLGQNPASTLTPTMRVGRQISETMRLSADDRGSVCRWLESFGLPGDRAFQRRFPHQLSGGQQQRVALARAFASHPRVVVLDEPTTGLDVATQDLVLTEIKRLQKELSLTVFVVSHDLAVIERLADRVLVLHRGEIVEQGDLHELLSTAHHEQTRTLLAADVHHGAMPRREPVCGDSPRPVMSVERLTAGYRATRRVVAVEDVSFAIHPGRCVAVVGSSGAGKTTIARCLVGLHRPDGGRIYLDGVEQAPAVRDRTPAERRRVQLIQQDSSGSLNPRHTVEAAIGRPLRLQGRSRTEATAEVGELLERVRLPLALARRMPSQLSGGERQRVAIAKALATAPDVLVCDEITSSLDRSVQATILDLVLELQRDLGLGVLLISHDLRVVASVADHVLLLDQGRVREQRPAAVVLGPREDVSVKARRLTEVIVGGDEEPPTRRSRFFEPTRY
jgi:peptide/nickel transport system ATP-binding protein